MRAEAPRGARGVTMYRCACCRVLHLPDVEGPICPECRILGPLREPKTAVVLHRDRPVSMMAGELRRVK